MREQGNRHMIRVDDGGHAIEALAGERRTNQVGALLDSKIAESLLMLALCLRLELVELRGPSSQRCRSSRS